jgi:hypothetical protein
VEHDDRAERLEHEADRMEEHSDEVGDQIEEAREDWEAKEEDSAVPGAQPDPGETEESRPGVATDPERVSEEGGP